MKKEWIDKSEAQYLTGKSITTIRRWIDEHKTKHDYIKKEKGKIYIKAQKLNEDYQLISEQQESNKRATTEETKHKKEAMQIAYNSENIKAQIEQIKAKDEHIREKDKQIELLIKSRDKKSYLAFYVTLGFVILIISLGTIFYYMFNSYQTEQNTIKQQEIKLLTSKYDMEVNFKDKLITDKETNLKEAKEGLRETKKELLETKTAYQQSLKAVDLLHVKYNDKLDTTTKEFKTELTEQQKQYQDKIKQLETRLKELSASHSQSAAENGAGE